jgi:glycosyltransferase involved in cell wall biosynthesis
MSRDFPPNARGRLLGNVPNQEIMQHYKENPVDLFVNVSSTEGGAPVAIQEAISCGIPVIATAVGGNPEVVLEKNGILLDPNPKPRDIAAALFRIWDDPQQAAQMKQESRQVWQRNYDADVNFRLFADRLRIMGAR